MHEAETRALRHAAVLLILISILRWGWAARGQSPPEGEASVLPELLTSSRDATADAARRDTPLAPGERVDPNRADEAELDRLPGVGSLTARAIAAARDSGTVFRTPEDLLSVRGIGPGTLDRIRGFLSLDGARAAPPGRASAGGTAPRDESGAGPVDLNSADLRDLQSLPGIGPALAERILVARREQPFTSLDDLARVRGIGPTTVERLRPFATVRR